MEGFGPSPDFVGPPRKESPGEEAQSLAGMIVPFIAAYGPKLDQDAVASIISSLLKWWRKKQNDT